MKVGILVECGRGGMEHHMCRRIVELLAQETGLDLVVDITPMDNKERLLEECGTAARDLLEKGCDRVVILWDERPAWPEKQQKFCWHNEREQVLGELDRAGLRDRPVYAVCIEREFESWLFFDEQMLSCVLSRPTHPVRVRAPKNPDRLKNPKGAMMTLFAIHGRRYVDAALGSHFARCLSNLGRLRRCGTFSRFVEKLVGP